MLVILHLALQIHFSHFSTLSSAPRWTSQWSLCSIDDKKSWQDMGKREQTQVRYLFLQFPSYGVTILLEESCNQKANIALINPQQVTVSFLVLGAFSSLVICFSAVSLLLFLVSLYPAHFLSIVSPLNLFQIILIWVCHLIPSVTLANRVNIFDLLIMLMEVSLVFLQYSQVLNIETIFVGDKM